MNEVQALVASIKTHEAVNNAFYDRWMGGRLAAGSLAVFARNYAEWVRSFPDSLAILVERTEDHEAKVEYAKTLYSELGYGNPAKAHGKLLENFLAALAERVDRGEAIRDALAPGATGLLPSTKALIDGERELYGHASRRVAAGAQLALEWQAYTMLRQLYEGARNYADLWNDADAFHEACEYFYVHIGAAEKDHKDQSMRAVWKYVPDGHGLDDVAGGYNRHLDLIAGFWNGIHDVMLVAGSPDLTTKRAAAGAPQGPAPAN